MFYELALDYGNKNATIYETCAKCLPAFSNDFPNRFDSQSFVEILILLWFTHS